MLNLLKDHLTTVMPKPRKGGGAPSSLSPCEAQIETSNSSLIADDPALLIGLALACVRQEAALAAVPLPILVRLAAHARYGNPAARLVLDWLASRHARLGLSPGSGTAHSVNVGRGRRSPRERVMEELARPEPQDVRPRGRIRPRWPREAASAAIAPEIGSVSSEVNHG